MSLSDGLMRCFELAAFAHVGTGAVAPETTAATRILATGCALEGVASVVVLGDCHGDGERLRAAR